MLVTGVEPSGVAGLDLEGGTARRLAAVALIFSAIAVPLGGLEQLTSPSHPGLSLPVTFALLGLIAVLSLAVYFLCSRGRLSQERVLDLGVAYEISMGFLLALCFHAASLPVSNSIRGWSPVAIWILVFPLIVPTTTGRVLTASFSAALLDPVGLLINVAAGAPLPSGLAVSRNLMHTVVSALLAPIASRIIYRLTIEAGKAREMGSYRLIELLGESTARIARL